MLMVPFLLNKAGSRGPLRLDISWPTAEFTKMVKSWDKFDEAKMGVIIRHIKR
jgi:poly(A) polymerase